MKPAKHRRSLKRRRVALLIESSRAYGRNLLMGIAKYVRAHHDWVVQSEEWRWSDPPPQWLHTWNGDGIIARIETPAVAKLISDLHIPTVDVRGSVNCGFPLLDTDDQAVAALAVDHFKARGFKNYAYCGFVGANYSDKRSQWFQECLANAGFACHLYHPPGLGREVGTIEYEKEGLLFQEHLSNWLISLPKPVAIMACNDIRGQQLINVCRKLDLAVPEFISIIGVDNDEVLCELSDPPLSSIMPDTVRIGYEAAALLEDLLTGIKPPPQPVLVPPVGVVSRRSTDVLAMEDSQLVKGVRFLREHAFGEIFVNDMARAAGMSRRVFERRFEEQMGRTPNAEVLRLRLERAKQLLTETDWSLSQIAERSGFNYVEYFHKVFTKKMGTTPRRFRLAGKSP